MKQTLRILLLSLLLPVCVLAAPNDEVLSRILKIAEPDQVEAYYQLNLSDAQETRLRSLAHSYLPEIEKQKVEPARMFGMISEALTKVDAILTPEQRPLARRLLPRPHQWERIRTLYRELQ